MSERTIPLSSEYKVLEGTYEDEADRKDLTTDVAKDIDQFPSEEKMAKEIASQYELAKPRRRIIRAKLIPDD